MDSSVSTKGEPKQVLKEQLRLFAFEELAPTDPGFLTRMQAGLSIRERLASLLEGELNFHGENSGYASHDLHAFAAKFPPQLPRAFIRGLTNPGDTVFDPMMGSGTTIVEALLEGRQVIGLDIDPLALRLSHVKTTPIDTHILREAGSRIITRAYEFLGNEKFIEAEIRKLFDTRTKEFIDYWFLPRTQYELIALASAIQEITGASERRFFELTFSSIIVTKSGGVSLARDLAHTRPHFDKNKKPKDAIQQYFTRLRKNIISIEQLHTNGINANIMAGDAKSMPLADEIADLIICYLSGYQFARSKRDSSHRLTC